MKYLVLHLLLLLFTSFLHAQNVSEFNVRDTDDKILCYTEKTNGTALKSTSVAFKNTSTCNGTCIYAWDYGDSRPQQIVKDKSDGVHEFYTDGDFKVTLATVNVASIHDTIKNKIITKVLYLNEDLDSVNLLVTYLGTGNVEKDAEIRIPKNEFDKKAHATTIEVYSPVVSGTNFTFEIDEPQSNSQTAAVQSFVYLLTVDTTNFNPHKKDYWTYYWDINSTKEDGSIQKFIERFNTDSLQYRYTFPAEEYSLGYQVKLTIALDTSKFEDLSILTNHDLYGCYASQTQLIEVTDYFFNDATRKEDNYDDRVARVPNIFTPGGNDENEVFYFNTNGVDVFTLYVYNSWGALVYQQEANTISWTGKDNSGEDCSSGTYYYVITSTDKNKKHDTAGYIHLFRQN